jgi:hypothetical protein
MSPGRWLLASIPIVALTLLIGSCEDNGVEVIEGGPGIIVPGKSVEGIKLGDSKETVVTILGKPTLVGWADGYYRSWRAYTYEEGSPVNPIMELYFNFIDNGDSYGPVDLIGIGSAYKGKTKEGIGVGSLLEKVHQAYGLPKYSIYSPQSNMIYDTYCINKHMFQIHYTDSLVDACSIGYFVPLPQDSLSCGK